MSEPESQGFAKARCFWMSAPEPSKRLFAYSRQRLRQPQLLIHPSCVSNALTSEGPFVSSCPASEKFAFDVFVSYRQQEPDMGWVRNVLVPAMEEKKLRVCIDHRDFRLGLPLLLEMGRAVEQSRFTLAVLTPAYLASNFTELESTMAEHLGLEQGERRLLTVMRVASSPRIGLRARLWLDMTKDEDFAVNVDRLVRELHKSAR